MRDGLCDDGWYVHVVQADGHADVQNAGMLCDLVIYGFLIVSRINSLSN